MIRSKLNAMSIVYDNADAVIAARLRPAAYGMTRAIENTSTTKRKLFGRSTSTKTERTVDSFTLPPEAWVALAENPQAIAALQEKMQ